MQMGFFSQKIQKKKKSLNRCDILKMCKKKKKNHSTCVMLLPILSILMHLELQKDLQKTQVLF